MRYPSSPCSAGVSPVAIELSAVAVVVGATVEIGPPAIEASVGASSRRSCSCSQPSPSSTRRQTWSDLATGSGIHGGSESDHAPGPSNAGTMPRTFAPA